MQVYCTRCGHQFQVAGQGPVYCPSCGVLLGPAPPNPTTGQSAPLSAPRSADPASGVPGYAPPGYAPPGYAPPGQSVPGYPPVYPAPVPAPGTVPLPQSPYAAGAGSSPYGYSYSPALAAAAAVAAKADRRLRRRSWLLRAALISLAVLLVAAAGVALVAYGRAQQPTQANVAPTPEIRLPDGFVEFSDPGGIFACGVPSGWEQVSSSSGSLTLAEFGDPAHQTTLSIQYTQDPTVDEIGADDQALAQLASSYSGGKLSSKTHAANGTFAGETWAEEDAALTYVGTSGTVSLRVATLSAIHEVASGSITSRYVVTMINVAPAASFDTTDADDFQLVQSSFVFEK